MKNKKNEFKNLFKKMTNDKNFISLDKVYMRSYSDLNANCLLGQSTISDSKDISSLIKATVKNAGIKSNMKLSHILLHIETPKKTPLENVIRIVANVEEHINCDFNFSVGTSNSKEIKLTMIAQKNTSNQRRQYQTIEKGINREN